jgi:hypothetical protein
MIEVGCIAANGDEASILESKRVNMAIATNVDAV